MALAEPDPLDQPSPDPVLLTLMPRLKRSKHESILILGFLAALSTRWLWMNEAAHNRSNEALLAWTSSTTAVQWGALAGRQYFVSNAGNDQHDGSLAHPWASLQHAADKAEAGSTIHVLPGLYRGPVVTRLSGQAGAPIRFLSERQWQARIIVTSDSAVWTNSGSYVDIAGFDVSGSGAYGILNLGSNVRIVGNYVHDIAAAGCTSDGGAGIDNADASGHDNDIIGNTVKRVGHAGSRCNRVHGIYHSNHGGYIWNNISCDNQGWGIHLWHAAQAVVIANNLVCRNGEGGIIIGAGDTPGAAPADHMLVTNNILIGKGNPDPGYAIEEFGSLGKDNHYLNNLIVGREQKIILKNGNHIAATIWTNPGFVNDQQNAADYHLAAGSPAIGTGTAAGAPPLDMDGRARPVLGRWDIGPYQYQSQGKPWPWY
jgi:hypothetical protein